MWSLPCLVHTELCGAYSFLVLHLYFVIQIIFSLYPSGSHSMSRSAWRRSSLRRSRWPRGELMRSTWSSTRYLTNTQTHTDLHKWYCILVIMYVISSTCVWQLRMQLCITHPVIMGVFAVGDGAAGRCQNRQAGEQSPAAQGWDHGEHQKTVPGLCGV